MELHILLAEDHNIVRNGIRMLLESDAAIIIAGEAVNGLDVLNYVANGGKVDLILADINMPLMDGISLTREIKVLRPEIKVVILSMYDSEDYVVQAFKAGASGYLLKNILADELIFALKHIYSGGRYLCSDLSMIILDKLLKNEWYNTTMQAQAIEFSVREIEVLHLIAEGFTNNEISDKLFISKRTVEGHRQNLIDKTGSRNTAALIKYAMVNGIIQ